MDNPQKIFAAAIKLLLSKLPRDRFNKHVDKEWILYERYIIPQALASVHNYKDSQTKPNPLKPNIDFNGADAAYHKCPETEWDKLTWASLQYLQCTISALPSLPGQGER
jgi:hypothetical protein